MHPTINYYLAQARIADMQRQADRDAIARAARRARGAGQKAVSRRRPRRAAAGRRVQAILVAATAHIRRRELAAPVQSTGQERS